MACISSLGGNLLYMEVSEHCSPPSTPSPKKNIVGEGADVPGQKSAMLYIG